MQLGERKTLKIQDSSQEDITLVPDTDDLLSIHRIKKTEYPAAVRALRRHGLFLLRENFRENFPEKVLTGLPIHAMIFTKTF